jgi:tellurite resistance protein
MPNAKLFGASLFNLLPLGELKARLAESDLADEADVAGLEPFMEAAVAASVVIAHADGEAAAEERRRILALLRAHPLLGRFSTDAVNAEIDGLERQFELDFDGGLATAKARIVEADLNSAQFRTLLQFCAAVIEADGRRHPMEEEALSEIASLRPWAYREAVDA